MKWIVFVIVMNIFKNTLSMNMKYFSVYSKCKFKISFYPFVGAKCYLSQKMHSFKIILFKINNFKRMAKF